MRKTIADQLPLVPSGIDHDHARELREMGAILDEMPQIVEQVGADLVRGLRCPERGRKGMTAEQVLRVLVLKQMRQLSYEQLAFHLADSTTYRAFCRFGITDSTPSEKALQRDVKKIRAETLESINALLVRYAIYNEVEDGVRVRTDCTVEQTNIHDPTDSSLLWDCVRVLARGMSQAQQYVDAPFSDHRRRAKRRFVAILHARRMNKRDPLYRDLLKVTLKTIHYVDGVAPALEQYEGGPQDTAVAHALAEELRHYAQLACRVVDQTQRRVFDGESVPAEEKIVSIFEPHTDIIVKDRRETHYGHKLCLTTGRSGMVLDCMVLDGNPADAQLAKTAIERVQTIQGRVPQQACFDGGFASKDNLASIKKLGVEDVVFSKKRGLAVSEMVRETWVYRCLKGFRAGIESMISYLKRCFGLDRCTWRSAESFRAYTWGSIVSANLVLLARSRMT